MVVGVIFEVLGASRGHLGAAGSLLGASWGFSGASWAALGSSWEALGRILKTSGGFGLSWRLMRRPKALWTLLERPWNPAGSMLISNIGFYENRRFVFVFL